MNSKTNEALALLAKHHAEFIKAAKAIAGNNGEVANYAEDFVQEAYLKLSKYEDLYERIIKDGKATKGYMFFALRSVIINEIKRKSSLNYDHVGDEYDFEERFLLTEQDMDPMFLGINKLEEKMFDVLKMKAPWFDYELFKIYITSGKSFSTIAEETSLGVQTIYLAIKRCKLLIAEELFNDYKHLLNGEFE